MKIGICGICGRMGVSVLKGLLVNGHQLGAAFDHTSAKHFGRDAGLLVQLENLGVAVESINSAAMRKVDGMIDFSAPASGMEILGCALKEKKPVVIGTTGFSVPEMEKISAASSEIPVLFSPNMSLGVNLLFKLTEMAAKALGSGFDAEIFEAHHRFKKDAPSGTAKKLSEIIRKNLTGMGAGREIFGREGITGERSASEIGVMAMRGGDIVGEHTVFFVGLGERLELVHRAGSRDTFARGAVRAIDFLKDKRPGLYTMSDVLGL